MQQGVVDPGGETTTVLEEIQAISKRLAEQGAYLECVSLHEKAITIKSRLYGNNSEAVLMERLEIADCYNKIALQILYRPSNSKQVGGWRAERPAQAPRLPMIFGGNGDVSPIPSLQISRSENG